MKIDWSRVPRGTKLYTSVGAEFYFYRNLDRGKMLVTIYPNDEFGYKFYVSEHQLTLADTADHAKYSVLDPQETRDIKNCDRILENAMYGLFSIRDIVDARLMGETIQYRPFTEQDAWIDATEQHIPDTDAYQYRIMPPSGCGAYRGDDNSDEVAAKHDRTVESAYRQWIASGVEEGLVDEAVKDRAMKMIISGTMKMEEVGIAPDTMDRLVPSAMAFFKKAILDGHFDEEAVARFKELWREGKVEYSYHPETTSNWTRVSDDGKDLPVYRLRPTPRYRAFTAVEALAHLSCRVRSKQHRYETFFSGMGVDYHESRDVNFHFGDPHKGGVSSRTPGQAFEDYEFLDGTPFGVKEE